MTSCDMDFLALALPGLGKATEAPPKIDRLYGEIGGKKI
jgi:hypothetical protein